MFNRFGNTLGDIMSNSTETNNEKGTKSSFGLVPVQAVVALDRWALKFLDIKGTLANKYGAIYDSVSWGIDDTIPAPHVGFTDQMQLSGKDKKLKIIVSIKRFSYEQFEFNDGLTYFANEVAKIAKEIDRDALQAAKYSRWGIRIWYKIQDLTVKELITKYYLGLNQNSELLNGTLEPKIAIIGFTGEGKKINLKYNLFVGSGLTFKDNEEVPPVPNHDIVTIDMDCYKENLVGLTELQNTIQSVILFTQSTCEQFINEILNR